VGEQKRFCEDLESNPTVRLLARIRKQTNKISVSFDTGLCGPCYCAGRYVGSVPVCMIQVSPFSTEGKESHIHTSRACVPGFRLGCPGEHHGTMPCSPLISDRGFPCGLPSNEILLTASIFIAVVRTPGMEGPKDSQLDACGSSLCHCFHCLVP
jgi:hypothetical protein